MRKIILGAVIVVFTLSASFLISGVVKKYHRQSLIKEKIEKLPSFSFLTLANGTFNSS